MNEVFKTKHPLFKEINTKFLNNDPNSNKKNFDVKLSDDEKKLIITNNGETEEYEVFIKTINSREFKCIHPDFKCIDPDNIENFDEKIIFKIVENDDQLNSLNNKNNKNFDRCIFLETFCSLSTSIDFQKGNPSFQYSIFKDGCNFDNIEIINSNFQDCIFFGWANFQKSIFKYDTNKISPFPYTTFSGSVFLNYANFIETKFESNAYFNNCIFKDADFNGAEFKQYISFYNSRFIKYLNLTGSKINKMILENTKIELLHLIGDEIKDDINCENTKIKDAHYRETFRKLKGICIKKSDNISALYFYTKEIDKHRCTLTWKDDFADKSILFFEKIASNYGTDSVLPVLWFLLIHSIDYFIRDCCNNSCNELEVKDFNIYKLNIIKFIESGLGFWFLIKIILSSVLIYEIIKSFRKFSRKL